MGRNLVQQIIEARWVAGKPIAGSEVAIRIDQTLTQDATGMMAYLQLEAMGVPHVKTRLPVSQVNQDMSAPGMRGGQSKERRRDLCERSFGAL